jgi:hypothetical protein
MSHRNGSATLHFFDHRSEPLSKTRLIEAMWVATGEGISFGIDSQVRASLRLHLLLDPTYEVGKVDLV